MIGFLGTGVLYLSVQGNLNATVPLFWYYAPHAYNLVIWPGLALLILRPRFGPERLLWAFLFAYSVDELLWNAIAYARFGGGGEVLAYMSTEYWTTFFTAVLTGLCVAYYVLRPDVVPNWTWVLFTVFVALYAGVAGLPTYINQPPSSVAYVQSWEIAWQLAVWTLIYGTFRARRSVPARVIPG